MKKLFALLLTCTALKAYTQDTARLIKQIDSIVFSINHTTSFTYSYDSVISDMPTLKLYIKNCDTTITEGKNLRKFVHASRSKTVEQGVPKTLITSIVFYYSAGRLVKTEEYMLPDSSHKIWLEWYYKDGKLLFNKAEPLLDTPEKKMMIQERGKMLFTMAEDTKNKAENKLPKK